MWNVDFPLQGFWCCVNLILTCVFVWGGNPNLVSNYILMNKLSFHFRDGTVYSRTKFSHEKCRQRAWCAIWLCAAGITATQGHAGAVPFLDLCSLSYSHVCYSSKPTMLCGLWKPICLKWNLVFFYINKK